MGRLLDKAKATLNSYVLSHFSHTAHRAYTCTVRYHETPSLSNTIISKGYFADVTPTSKPVFALHENRCPTSSHPHLIQKLPPSSKGMGQSARSRGRQSRRMTSRASSRRPG